jgi:hypothetical protein
MFLVASQPDAEHRRLLQSCYGLALALVRREFDVGRRLCEEAIVDGPLDPELYMNLALVYLQCHRRRLAVEALKTVLSINPEHAAAAAQLDRLGRRRPPVFPFLPRRHLLNRMVGKWRHQWIVRRSEASR